MVAFTAPVLQETLRCLGCRETIREQSWLIRLWRHADAELRKMVLTRFSMVEADCEPHQVDNLRCNEVEEPCTSVTVQLTAEEWNMIKPAVTKSGSIKLVDWTSLFSRKLSSVPQTASCTLKGCQHVVKRIYRSGEVLSQSGVFYGSMKCANDCSVSVKFRSIQINPADITEVKFDIYGHGQHTTVKPRQLRGPARMKEVALGVGTASERRAHLVRQLGEYSSHVYAADVLCKARSEVRTALRGGVNVDEELRVLHATMKPSFVRGISCVPFCVLLWSKSMLDCYTETVRRSGRVELFMDATGGKLKQVDGKAVYATSVVLANAKIGRPQIAVAMML